MLLQVGKKLQKMYSLTLFFMAVISSTFLCFGVFRISTAKSFTDYWFYISYALVMGLQVLLYCYYGQKLINASESVADGIYFCNWEAINDNDLKKKIVPVMIRGQRATRPNSNEFRRHFFGNFYNSKYNKYFV